MMSERFIATWNPFGRRCAPRDFRRSRRCSRECPSPKQALAYRGGPAGWRAGKSPYRPVGRHTLAWMNGPGQYPAALEGPMALAPALASSHLGTSCRRRLSRSLGLPGSSTCRWETSGPSTDGFLQDRTDERAGSSICARRIGFRRHPSRPRGPHRCGSYRACTRRDSPPSAVHVGPTNDDMGMAGFDVGSAQPDPIPGVVTSGCHRDLLLLG